MVAREKDRKRYSKNEKIGQQTIAAQASQFPFVIIWSKGEFRPFSA